VSRCSSPARPAWAEALAKGALLAISGGLIVAIPTALTGLLDYLPKRTAARSSRSTTCS